MAEERATAGSLKAAGVSLNERGTLDTSGPEVKTIPSGYNEHDMAAVVAVFNAKQKGPQTPLGSLKGWCELQAALAKTVRHKSTAAWAYSCTYDLVGREGHAYTPRPLPAKHRRLTPKNCFGNSFSKAARSPALTYVEGYGMTSTGIPSHHAWCVDERGAVVDTTWAWSDDPEDDHMYVGNGALLGIPIPTELLKLIWSTRTNNGALEDWEHDFPALQEPWDLDALAAHYEVIASRGRRSRARQKRA